MKSVEQHVDGLAQTKNNKKPLINNKISESFKSITNIDKLNRINGAVSLLQLLKEFKSDENQIDKVRNLKRLIRGLGASTSDSRTGFYTTLVAYLSTTSDDDYPSITTLFEFMDATLNVGTGSHLEKEDADALIGRVLTCGAILHSKKIQTASNSEITKCVAILINASHYRLYHSSLAYTFLLELMEILDASQFEKIVWPLMQKELKRPWEKQNINTVQFLLKCQLKYPRMVDDEFLLSSLQSNEILSPLAYKHFSRLFWSPASAMIAATHPSYESLGMYFSAIPEMKLLDFWQREINEILLAPNKFKEMVTLRLLTILFTDGKVTANTVIKLLSNPFIAMISKSIRNVKQQKPSELDHMGAFYLSFFDSIEKYLQNSTNIQESDKVQIIQRFIDYPGTLTIEKFSPIRFIHKFISQLKAEGIHQLFDFYKSILLDKKIKNPKTKEIWLHTDKEHCVQMLQALLLQRSVHNDHAWRTEQLIFLLKYGLFYVDKKTDKITPKDNEPEDLPSDIAHKMKQAFYASLQVKSQNLEAERKSLISLIEFCNEHLSAKYATKALRSQLSDETLQAWNKMYETVSEKKKSKKISFAVFDVLMIHMGLHLFVDCDLAIFSINDLEKCIERAQSKVNKKSKRQSTNNSTEAEWIEVVVDLFLQLLSQNKSFLRNIVDNVFPELCKHLTASAVDQILLMLDMGEKNPLTPHSAIEEDVDDSSDESDGSDDEKEEGENSDSDIEMGSDEENISDEDEDEGTVNDQFRSAVSQALGTAVPETDTESVDLNDMDDDEVVRLDIALSEAFRSYRHKSNGGKKKTKLERTTNTTVMHFRIRVLDLIEIYLKTNPTLEITLNILTEMIPLYENCSGNKDLEPLKRRVSHVLKTLFSVKEFSNMDDVTEVKLYELFESIIDIKANPLAIADQNKLKSNIIGFLITVSQLLKSSDQILLEAITDCLEHFLKSRNPRIQFSSFIEILRFRWIGVWKLGQIIARTLLQADTSRPFRRLQAIEMLIIIYKNHAFISNEIDEFNEYNQKIEGAIQNYVYWLKADGQASSKEFTGLIQLLQEVHKCSQTTPNYKCIINWTKVCDAIQIIRRKTELNSYQVYFAFCKHFNMKDIKNSEIQIVSQNGNLKQMNGKSDDSDDNDDSDENDDSEDAPLPKQVNGSAKKRKAAQQNNGPSKKRKAKMEKKLRKQNRLKMSSVGLDNHSFKFTSNNDKDIEVN